jgi:redox-sensitive bicupin YhaK (pirin superfamily)
MITLRKSKDRGFFDHGWLKTYHTFSFGDYMDPRFRGFRSLRVINEDWVQASDGFGTHGHRDMEIVTYVLQGSLEHKDSMGNGSIIKPGDVQYMSAGTGVEHSEFNPSKNEAVHLFQIWIFPDKKDYTPRYDQKNFSKEQKQDRLLRIVSHDGKEGSIAVRQDVQIFASLLSHGKTVTHSLPTGRFGWVQLASGALKVNGVQLEPGDGASVSMQDESSIQFEGIQDCEFLFFDLN